VDEWLRVREEDGKASINYKLWQPRQAEKSTYCNEYESKITSPSDVKAILAALDFKQLIVVDKTRKSFQFEDSEISVDVIEGLGSFIEAEFNGAGEDKEAVARNLVDQLQRLGAKTGEQDYRGYPYRLLEKAGFFKQKS
jgi:adenylate cyclase class 2